MNEHRPSVQSLLSTTYSESSPYSGDKAKAKQRCPFADCGKTFKDLKAHMISHQTERPEKCPVQTCEFHIKGFARKYDKDRHTMTHYKGSMVCGFCPGSGTAAELSFSNAGAFKKHLATVHGVEQTPSAGHMKRHVDCSPDVSAKCSTCSHTFSNAHDFYGHLDNCVLRIVQQEDPTEAVNVRLLAEVENDQAVVETLERHNLHTQPVGIMGDDDEMDGINESATSAGLSPSKYKPGTSRGGVTLQVKSKSRKNRLSKKQKPASWGYAKELTNLKKRVMCAFDGSRRLAKEDMMFFTEQEVRIHFGDGESYTTDLDIFTMMRAEAFHNATGEDKALPASDEPTEYAPPLDAEAGRFDDDHIAERS